MFGIWLKVNYWARNRCFSKLKPFDYSETDFLRVLIPSVWGLTRTIWKEKPFAHSIWIWIWLHKSGQQSEISHFGSSRKVEEILPKLAQVDQRTGEELTESVSTNGGKIHVTGTKRLNNKILPRFGRRATILDVWNPLREINSTGTSGLFETYEGFSQWFQNLGDRKPSKPFYQILGVSEQSQESEICPIMFEKVHFQSIWYIFRVLEPKYMNFWSLQTTWFAVVIKHEKQVITFTSRPQPKILRNFFPLLLRCLVLFHEFPTRGRICNADFKQPGSQHWWEMSFLTGKSEISFSVSFHFMNSIWKDIQTASEA